MKFHIAIESVPFAFPNFTVTRFFQVTFTETRHFFKTTFVQE